MSCGVVQVVCVRERSSRGISWRDAPVERHEGVSRVSMVRSDEADTYVGSPATGLGRLSSPGALSAARSRGGLIRRSEREQRPRNSLAGEASRTEAPDHDFEVRGPWLASSGGDERTVKARGLSGSTASPTCAREIRSKTCLQISRVASSGSKCWERKRDLRRRPIFVFKSAGAGSPEAQDGHSGCAAPLRMRKPCSLFLESTTIFGMV